MNPAYDFEDIEDYLEDRMSESDRQAFEQALETDPSLVQRVAALKAEPKVLRLLRDEHLLDQFAAWDKEETEKKTAVTSSAPSGGGKVAPFNRQWWLPLAAAASLAGVITAGIIFGWYEPGNGTREVVKTEPPGIVDTAKLPVEQPVEQETVAETAPDPSQKPGTEKDAEFYAALAAGARLEADFEETLMGAGDDEEPADNYTKAIQLYGEKRFKEALRLLEKAAGDQEDQYLYLRGHVYFQLKQYNKAERDFHEIRKFPVSGRKIDAVWCEAVCQVHQLPGSRKRLDAALQEIMAKPGHHYFNDAAKLKQALEKR